MQALSIILNSMLLMFLEDGCSTRMVFLRRARVGGGVLWKKVLKLRGLIYLFPTSYKGTVRRKVEAHRKEGKGPS